MMTSRKPYFVRQKITQGNVKLSHDSFAKLPRVTTEAQSLTHRHVNSKSFNNIFANSSNKDVKFLNEITQSFRKGSESNAQEQMTHQLNKRIELLDQIIPKLNNNNQSEVQDALHQLTSTLSGVSKNEILLTQSQRENDFLKVKHSQQNLQVDRLSEKLLELRKQLQKQQETCEELREENKKLTKRNQILQKDNATLSQKLKLLEERMQLLLETEIIKQKDHDNDNKLLENELLKKETTHIRQENQRYQGQVKTLEQNVQRLNARLSRLETKQNMPDKQTEAIIPFTDIDLLQAFQIPKNLNYKIISQKLKAQHHFYQLLEMGPSQLSKKLKLEEKETIIEKVEYYATQLMNYKDHVEKFNNLVIFMVDLLSKSSIQDVILSVNTRTPHIFGCEYVKLWIIDAMTGMIYTFNTPNTEQRAYTQKGLISEVFKYRRAGNYFDVRCKKPILFRTGKSEEPEYCKQCLIVPVFAQGNILRGVLQISNSEGDVFTFDEEYYAIVISKLLEQILKKIVESQLTILQNKYFPLIIDAFQEIMQTKSEFEFTYYVKRWMGNIFGISTIHFYFIHGNMIRRYDDKDKIFEYELGEGLVGMVAKTQQGLIINNVKQSSLYNENIDMKSLLPIYSIPLVSDGDLETYGDEETIAVIQLPLKSRFMGILEKDKLLCPGEEYSGMDENIQKQIIRFSKIVIIALQNISWNQNK